MDHKIQPDAGFGNPSNVYPNMSGDPPAYSGPAPVQYQPQAVQYQPQAVTVVPGTVHTMVPGATVITPGATVVTGVPGTMVVGAVMGPEPSTYTCRSCHQQITTNVVRRSTLRTHLMALLLCVFGCWPCVCLPYCMDSCRNAEHYCPNCNAYIGSYTR